MATRTVSGENRYSAIATPIAGGGFPPPPPVGLEPPHAAARTKEHPTDRRIADPPAGVSLRTLYLMTRACQTSVAAQEAREPAQEAARVAHRRPERLRVGLAGRRLAGHRRAQHRLELAGHVRPGLVQGGELVGGLLGEDGFR